MLDIGQAKSLLHQLRTAPESFSPADLAELDTLLEAVAPARPFLTFTQFVEIADPSYLWWWHNRAIARCCEALIDGVIENLLVSCPPRHSKSRTISELFTAYYAYRFPFRRIGLSSATDGLAIILSSGAQKFYQIVVRHVLKQKLGIGTAHNWEFGEGGYLWATGVGGQATGLGAHLLVSDDPVKNSQEAESKVIRNQRIKWFESTWFTRVEPNVRRIVIMTRWHELDPAGYILKQAELGGEFARPWHVLNFELLRSEEPYEVPKSCTLEPDPRPVWNGRSDHHEAALCPARMPLREILRTKATTSAYYWNAVYQGRPKPLEGALFKIEQIKTVGACPVDVVERVWFFDLAGTDEKFDENNDPDFTVGIRMSRGRDGLFYVEAMVRVRLRPGARNIHIKVRLDEDALSYGYTDSAGERFPNRDVFRVGFESEAGIEGEDRTRALKSTLAGYRVKDYRPRRSKVSRATIGETLFAESLQSQVEAGNIRIVKGEWNPQFLDEMRSFPFGAHDDIVDATVGAFEMLASGEDLGELPPLLSGGQAESYPLRIG